MKTLVGSYLGIIVATLVAIVILRDDPTIVTSAVWVRGTWRSGRRNELRNQALEQASEANRRLAASLAENATLHERLVAQAREAGVLDERARMAREIHDTLAQA